MVLTAHLPRACPRCGGRQAVRDLEDAADLVCLACGELVAHADPPDSYGVLFRAALAELRASGSYQSAHRREAR